MATHFRVKKMNFIEKKRELAAIIKRDVIPLIDDDYVLYGLPYYNNVGDTLIWNGELELLKNVPHKCIGVCGWDDYPETKLPENAVILITGGGYFGDVWRRAWNNVLNGIRPNKNNKIIIMPCSIFYDDPEIRDRDATYLEQFPNLVILARDKVSLEIAKKHFNNEARLVPDMAFCMNEKEILKYATKKPSKNTLLFMRGDKELVSDSISIQESTYDTGDWLPMQDPALERPFNRLDYRGSQLLFFSKNLRECYTEWLYKVLYRRIMTKAGLKQLSDYRKIYTTRLHAMILGLMLGREVFFIDNTYGKLSSFYNTWLKDCDTVQQH